MHIAEAKRTLGTSIPWLSDDMDGAFTNAMGRAPNSEFIIGPDGTIVKAHGWQDVTRLRAELAELVGPVENPTRPVDLGLPTPIPVAAAATGIVPRIERPEFMVPVEYEPLPGVDGEPFYAKLRAEVTRELIREGNGTLYLGFLPDPLYNVHWNNLVAPIRVEVEGSETVELQPSATDGPQVAVEADADPREFLITVRNWQAEQPLTVSVFYYACSDEAGWCKPVQQSYQLTRTAARASGFTFRPEYRERIVRSMEWRDEGPPPQLVSADEQQVAALTGDWSMQTSFDGQIEEWKLHIDYAEGRISAWSTFDRAGPDVDVISFDGRELRFLQLAGPGPEEIVVTLDGQRLNGTQLSPFGDFSVLGERSTETSSDEWLASDGAAEQAGTPRVIRRRSGRLLRAWRCRRRAR